VPEEKFGKSGNHHVNSRENYPFTHRMCTFLRVPIYLYPHQSICPHKVKTAKVAQYPVADTSCINGDGFEQRWKKLISRTRREQEKMEINLHGVIAPPTKHLLKEWLML
jgi:hypothetical protein